MRKLLAVCTLLLLATFAAGQIVSYAGQQPAGPLMGAPVLTGPTILFPYPTTGGLVVQSGYATTAGWGYPPMVTAPTASFSTLSTSPVGATNATSNLQVGASNSTVEGAAAPLSAVQTGIEITQPGLLPLGAVAAQYAQPAQPPADGASTDLGAARFDVVNARAPGDVRSLGEVVRELRQQPKPAPARTFTNADLQNLKDHDKPASQVTR